MSKRIVQQYTKAGKGKPVAVKVSKRKASKPAILLGEASSEVKAAVKKAIEAKPAKNTKAKGQKFALTKSANLTKLRPGSARFEVASALQESPLTREQVAELIGSQASQALRVLMLQGIVEERA